MSADLSPARLIADDMDASAEWRSKKADEYPADAVRNLDCAAQFSEMAKRLRRFSGGPSYEKYVSLLSDPDNALKMSEKLRDDMATIHFVACEPEHLFEVLIAEIDKPIRQVLH